MKLILCLEDVTIRQSPFWTIHLLCSEDVVVRGLDVYCDLKNSDGIDIESSKNVLVENCTFEQGDDAVVIKSGINHDGRRRAIPSEDIVLEDIFATSAKAVYSFRGYKTEPIRGLKLRNIKVGKVKNPSSAELVEDMSVVDTPSFR